MAEVDKKQKKTLEEMFWEQAVTALSVVSSVFTQEDLENYCAELYRVHRQQNGKFSAIDWSEQTPAEIASVLESRNPSLSVQDRDNAKALVGRYLEKDGNLVALEATPALFTTQTVLDEEKVLIETASKMTQRGSNPVASERAMASLEKEGFGVFMEFPASDEMAIELKENLSRMLSFPDLGILNGPPGTGKSTICQNVALAMLETRGADGLLPEGAKIYATSPNPKAAADLADDLLKGVSVQQPPEEPEEPPATAPDDEKEAFKNAKKIYQEALKRYNADMIKVAEIIGISPFEDNGTETREAYNERVRNAYNMSKRHQEHCDAIVQTSLDDLIEGMKAGKVPKGSCIMVDEAGMMGRQDMVELLKTAEKSGVRLYLVGDNLQIPPKEAGFAFDLLVKKVATNEDGLENEACSVTTKRILRQERPAEAKAGIDIRNGVAEKGKGKDKGKGIYVYAKQQYTKSCVNEAGEVTYITEDALSFCRDDKEAQERLIVDYVSYISDPKNDSSVVLTTTWEKADDLAEKIREEMKAEGLIKKPMINLCGLEVGTGDSLIFTAAFTMKNGREKMDVVAGATAKCTIDEKNPNLVTFDFGKDKKITIDVSKQEFPKQLKDTYAVKSAFALPLSLAQGMSKNRAFLCLTKGDVLDEPNGLVAFTRHRKQMSAYISEEAYADIDALAKDIVRAGAGKNASDYKRKKEDLKKRKEDYYKASSSSSTKKNDGKADIVKLFTQNVR